MLNTMHNLSSIDPSRCPVCGQANRCAMEKQKETGVAQGPCWCTSVAFAASLLESLPAPAKDRACICAACADQFHLRAS
jgi:hypothetical protein